MSGYDGDDPRRRGDNRKGLGLELKHYFRILRRNWIAIVASVLIGILGSSIASLLVRPSYVSETKLFVAMQSSGSVTELQQGNAFTQARVQSYVKTVTTPSVLQPAIDTLGLELTPDTLAQSVMANSDANTVLINISVANESPVRAAALAQAIADSLVRAVDELEKPSTGGTSPVRLSVISPASVPAMPSSPNTRLYLGLGLFGGLAVGVGFAALRTVVDTRIRGELDLKRVTESPILGGISYTSDAVKKPLLTQASRQSPRAESFRQLRTNLQFAHVSHESKTLLVTSSVPGEGKSTTATNLAIALAESGQSVVLVDADLRRPMVAEYLGLESRAGLTTALVGLADVNDLLQPWGEDALYVLTSGRVPPNPSELLGSEKMKQLITRLENTFDAVIIDAPPLLPVTDAAVLAQQVGGVVLVVGVQKVRTTDVEKSIAALGMVHAHLLGLVLNRLPSKGPDAYAYGRYSYENAEDASTLPAEATASIERASEASTTFDFQLQPGTREARRLGDAPTRTRSAR
jgi:capsular exopolysaccharide synthesis family protein